MKKKLWILILTVVLVCFALVGCGEGNTPGGPDVPPGSKWEDEVIEDQEHDEVELPEIGRS